MPWLIGILTLLASVPLLAEELPETAPPPADEFETTIELGGETKSEAPPTLKPDSQPPGATFSAPAAAAGWEVPAEKDEEDEEEETAKQEEELASEPEEADAWDPAFPGKGATETATSRRFAPTEDFDPDIPGYQRTRPALALEIAVSPKAFENTFGAPSASATSAVNVRGVTLQFEYQPPFIQEYGVLGIGPTLGIYPVSPNDIVTRRPTGVLSVGGQVRYQLKLLREQPIVPMAGYQFEYVFYNLITAQGRLPVTGPMVGAMLLLNWLEPSQAASFYAQQGVSRTYLVAEARFMKGSDSSVTLDGRNLFFGVRFEF